jgi:hypothetical protein
MHLKVDDLSVLPDERLISQAELYRVFHFSDLVRQNIGFAAHRIND